MDTRWVISLFVERLFGLVRLEDGGRPGYRRLGVPPGGAFDQGAMHRANAMLGNNPDASVLELSMASISLRANQAITLALSDKISTKLVVLQNDDLYEIPIPTSGARAYIAAHGGFIGKRILGSVSGGLVRQGDLIEFVPGGAVTAQPEMAIAGEREGPIDVIPGPQSNLFDLSMLESKSYDVSLQSNRTGVLLEGDPFVTGTDLPSEPACVGAIQVNNRGQLMILGPDGPTIGGYPKIAVVRESEMSRVAQLRPGETVQFKLKRS